MRSLAGLAVPALVVLVLIAACDDPASAPVPATLEVVQAPTSVGAPGFALFDTLRVRVVGAAGQPVEGAAITWSVRAGGGSVYPLTESSDADGVAAAIWTLGTAPGPNELRATGQGDASVTFQATGEVFRASKVAAGDQNFACGLVQGAIWCWGWGSPVQGLPVTNYDVPGAWPAGHQHYANGAPALLDDAREYIDIAIGDRSRICGLDTQSAVWCTGSSVTGPMAEVSGFPPIQVGSLIGSYWGGVCGLAVSDSLAWCWNAFTASVPAPIAASPAFTRLKLEFFGRFYCGLLADSTAACWGEEPPGNGTTVPSATPVAVSGSHKFVDLAVGSYFGCGRTALGDLWCWGKASQGGGATYLAPQLTASVVNRAAATEDWLITKSVGGGVDRGFGPNLGADPMGVGLDGLEQVNVSGFAEDGLNCVLGVGSEVYCLVELWSPWTGFSIHEYFPVQPVRPVLLSAERTR